MNEATVTNSDTDNISQTAVNTNEIVIEDDLKSSNDVDALSSMTVTGPLVNIEAGNI